MTPTPLDPSSTASPAFMLDSIALNLKPSQSKVPVSFIYGDLDDITPLHQGAMLTHLAEVSRRR